MLGRTKSAAEDVVECVEVLAPRGAGNEALTNVLKESTEVVEAPSVYLEYLLR